MSRSWYIISVFTGHERKVESTIRTLLEKNEIDSNVITNVKVLEHEIKSEDDKKKPRKEIFMPGYVMLEMDLPQYGWKDPLAVLYKIQGVTGFVGCVSRKDHPIAITQDEAKKLLMQIGVMKADKLSYTRQSFSIGENVKITEGAFASFTGVIKDVSLEKEKLSVEVQIFGRATPVELSFSQAEKN